LSKARILTLLTCGAEYFWVIGAVLHVLVDVFEHPWPIITDATVVKNKMSPNTAGVL
jgi:hypothetical protein